MLPHFQPWTLTYPAPTTMYQLSGATAPILVCRNSTSFYFKTSWPHCEVNMQTDIILAKKLIILDSREHLTVYKRAA